MAKNGVSEVVLDDESNGVDAAVARPLAPLDVNGNSLNVPLLHDLMQQIIDWALSSLNKSRDELLDVCFVVYLEFYVKIFKVNVEAGSTFLKRFALVFEEKFGHFIKQLLDFKFTTQLTASPVLKFSSKHLIIITKRTRKLIEDWLDTNEASIIGHVIQSQIEFIDGETLNHSSVHIYKRHFITKYGLDPESVLKYRRPFLGLYIKDFDNEIKVTNAKSNLILGGASQDVPLGLPFELAAEDPHAENTHEPMETISGEVAILEDAHKLVPLPRPGTDIYNFIRANIFTQVGNRNNLEASGGAPGRGVGGGGAGASSGGGKHVALYYTLQNAPHANSCATSASDGRFVALGCSDGTILLWDLVASESIYAQKDLVPVVGEAIASKCISLDASMDPLVSKLNNSGGASGGIEESVAAYATSVLSGHDGTVLSLQFGEDGKVLISGGVDGQIRLWTCFGTRATRAIYHGSTGAVLNLDYGPFGYYFCSSGADGSARLWATDRSFPLRILRTVHADVLGAVFHPNSSLLCTPSSDGALRLWDLRSSCCDVVLQCSHVQDSCKAVAAFSKNGQLLASAQGNVVNVYDLYTRKRIQLLPGHQDAIRALSFSYGTSILAASDHSSISLWNINHPKPGTRRWQQQQQTQVQQTQSQGTTTKMASGFEKLTLQGALSLNSAFSITDSQLVNLAYTPENVLLALGLSTLDE